MFFLGSHSLTPLVCFACLIEFHESGTTSFFFVWPNDAFHQFIYLIRRILRACACFIVCMLFCACIDNLTLKQLKMIGSLDGIENEREWTKGMVRMSSVAMLAFDCECKNKQNRGKKTHEKETWTKRIGARIEEKKRQKWCGIEINDIFFLRLGRSSFRHSHIHLNILF